MRKLLSILCFSILLLSCQREAQNVLPPQSLPAQTLQNVAYGNDPAQKMDIYLPAGRTDTTKVLIMVHGGAWIEGDKTDMAQFVPVLQQRLPGYVIVNLNYRLATVVANHFPAQETDMKAAVDFLIQKSGEYKFSHKFVLLGASAGAHMALLQAYKYNTPSIKAVVDFFGPSDMVGLYNSTTDPAGLIAFQILMQGTPSSNAALYEQSSPIHFVSAQSPPTIILHGTDDMVVPVELSILLANKLQSFEVVHQLELYNGLGHDVWPEESMTDAFDKIEAFIETNVE